MAQNFGPLQKFYNNKGLEWALKKKGQVGPARRTEIFKPSPILGSGRAQLKPVGHDNGLPPLIKCICLYFLDQQVSRWMPHLM
ncbi:hypothetical protein TorRG33x02_093910 [Trema orientale]|uniref:Uncharacterized protein n=1 Tax=Trema orientale TaxID=63057 RepID=A0A2P5FAS2_TREOI|nr:hypothetical protein TorRG33x02_093910 [Trema orientale]